MIRKYLSFGNAKLPKTTAIFNMTSATDCPAKKLGLCMIPDICYAMKAERMRPDVLTHRRRQCKFWKNVSAKEFARQFIEMNNNKRIKVDTLRFSEAGDFSSQDDINKADKIAELLKEEEIITYTYTARSDLDFSNIKSLIVNGTYFKKRGIRNTFIPVSKFTNRNDREQCILNCRICNKCIIGENLDIEVEFH